MNLVNGVESDTIRVSDRGLMYGDGVFRTFTLRGGKPVLWREQYAKLAADCLALRIACAEAVIFERDLAVIAVRQPDCVVKVMVTRGSGARGYAIPAAVSPQRILSASSLPDYPRSHYDDGVRICWCRTRLASQPLLAGVKHLNRLENVLARSEWSDPDIAEGLMRDAVDNVIGGTMSNLFLVKEGVLLTPDLTRSGVAGVMRQLIIDSARGNGITVRIAAVGMPEVLAADELFLVNSVIGVWQVRALGDQTWGHGPLTARVRRWLSDAQER